MCRTLRKNVQFFVASVLFTVQFYLALLQSWCGLDRLKNNFLLFRNFCNLLFLSLLYPDEIKAFSSLLRLFFCPFVWETKAANCLLIKLYFSSFGRIVVANLRTCCSVDLSSLTKMKDFEINLERQKHRERRERSN